MFLALFFWVGLGFLVFKFFGYCMMIETPFLLVLLLRRVVMFMVMTMMIKSFRTAKP